MAHDNLNRQVEDGGIRTIAMRTLDTDARLSSAAIVPPDLPSPTSVTTNHAEYGGFDPHRRICTGVMEIQRCSRNRRQHANRRRMSVDGSGDLSAPSAWRPSTFSETAVMRLPSWSFQKCPEDTNHCDCNHKRNHAVCRDVDFRLYVKGTCQIFSAPQNSRFGEDHLYGILYPSETDACCYETCSGSISFEHFLSGLNVGRSIIAPNPDPITAARGDDNNTWKFGQHGKPDIRAIRTNQIELSMRQSSVSS